MKKQNLLTLAFLFTAVMLQAQSVPATIYGFKRQTTGGAQKKGDITENGVLTKEERAQVFQYTIYLATASKTRAYPAQLWINGEAYSVKAKAVATQALQTGSDASVEKLQTALPKATTQVYQLMPVPLVVDKSSGRGKALAQSNAVVVLYKMAGKGHYGVLKKFTELEPVSLQ